MMMIYQSVTRERDTRMMKVGRVEATGSCSDDEGDAKGMRMVTNM